MNSALVGVWQHMQCLGLGALAHANRHAAYYTAENDRWSDLSVLQAAHAAELLIKARIAQEHPLLIFDQLPYSRNETDTFLNVQDLFKRGKTVQWSDLPERLWATTGIHLPKRELFVEYGKVRNGIQHFAPMPGDSDVSGFTLKFIYEVIDPFIYDSWGLFAIDFDEDHDPHVYLTGALFFREILFNVSEEAADCCQYWDVDWSAVSLEYKNEMESRIKVARGNNV